MTAQNTKEVKMIPGNGLTDGGYFAKGCPICGKREWDGWCDFTTEHPEAKKNPNPIMQAMRKEQEYWRLRL